VDIYLKIKDSQLLPDFFQKLSGQSFYSVDISEVDNLPTIFPSIVSQLEEKEQLEKLLVKKVVEKYLVDETMSKFYIRRAFFLDAKK
jgi:hypothetical protein